jgi:hypothetical protein
MRTAWRLSAATLIALLASHAVAHAEKFTRYDFKGEVVPEPTTAETIAEWVPPENILAVLIAFCLPGIPLSIFWPFAALTLYFGWKFAICLSFGYYLLMFLMRGSNDAYE